MNDRDSAREAELVRLLMEGDPAAAETASEDREARAYRETLGLLAHSLEPAAPRAEIKGTLLARVEREQEAARFTSRAAEAAAPARSTPARWALPLVAGLALWMVGVSFWLSGQVREQRAAIAALTAELESSRRSLDQLGAVQVQMASARENLRLVTTPGVELCTLEPVDEATAASRGNLYVSADHQHWYLAVFGLEPCAEGRIYHLWFEVDGGRSVSGGSFDVKKGVIVELSSPTMPAGVRAVRITLERGPDPIAPEGPTVLFGNEMVQLL